MEKYFVLKDEEKYYVAEGKATYTLEKALKIKSIEEFVSTIPIMKDWNWDYELYEVVNGRAVKSDVKWGATHDKWKKENPEAYEKLYSASGFENFIRTTTN